MRRKRQSQVQQQSREVMQQFGYTPPPTQEEIRAQHRQALQVRYTNTRNRKMQEYHALLNEIRAELRYTKTEAKVKPAIVQKLRLVDTSSLYYKKNYRKYHYVLNEIAGMLSGNRPLSLKRAVWITESMHPDITMSYEEFGRRIDEFASLVKYILKKEGFKATSLALNYAIQKLYSDTIKIYNQQGKLLKTHYPLSYDFEDFFGEKDYRKLFVTKLLRTGTGQCSSMPLLYMILAEQLGAEAYLSYSPSHSFIQAKDPAGRFFNFETTNGRITTRDWLIRSNYLKAEAIKNKIYLYPLNFKEVVAECLVNLASAYVKDFGYDGFSLICAETCLKVFPHSVRAPMLIANLGLADYVNTAYKLGFPSNEELDKHPRLKGLKEEVVNLNARLEMAGYEDMPEEAYEAWLSSVEQEKKYHDAMSDKIMQNIK